MAQIYNKLEIDVNNSITDIITAVQNDANSRFLDVVLLDGAVPVDLTGHEVRIYGVKADGTEFYNDGEITDSENGRCQFELTSQALAVADDLKVQIIIFEDNTEILSTQDFTIHVVKSLMSDSSIESSNEYNALVVLYQNLYEAYDLMTEMVQKIGTPETKAQELSLSTMFEVWDYLIEYLEENSSAGVVEGVNSVLDKIGDSTDTDSVLGILDRGVIKSVQYGVGTTTANYSGSYQGVLITHSSVDINKSVVLLRGEGGSTNNLDSALGKEVFISTRTQTTIEILAYTISTTTGKFSWQVIEFY